MSDRFSHKRTLLDATDIERIIRRMADQIVELEGGTSDLLLIGIRTRGVPLAERLAHAIETGEGASVPLGTLDITLYRDDLSTIGPQPMVKGTKLPRELDGKVVVLCDDVLFTGRTIRAAMDAIADYGRPRAQRLAVLVDRGHRELPIQADVVGREVPTSSDEHVEVRFLATDGEDSVELLERHAERDSRG